MECATPVENVSAPLCASAQAQAQAQVCMQTLGQAQGGLEMFEWQQTAEHPFVSLFSRKRAAECVNLFPWQLKPVRPSQKA